MAIYVLLLKEYEDGDIVIYGFGPNERQMGKIQLDKRTERFAELQPVPEVSSPRRLFDGAATRIARLWREGGVFPERTVYAA